MVLLRAPKSRSFWQYPRWWAFVCGLLLIVLATRAGGTTIPWYQRPIIAVTAPLGQGARWLRAAVWPARSRETARDAAAISPVQVTHEEQRLALDRLRALLGMGPVESVPVCGARVVRQDLQGLFKTLLINRGRDAGVRTGMAVLAAPGLVGRIARVAPQYATVLLLTDPNHAVDVLVQRSRARGVLRGHIGGTTLGRVIGVSRIEYLEGRSDVQMGDVVVSSGLDGRYPAGLPVGTVQRVTTTADGLLLRAEVVPFIDWTVVEEVLVLPLEEPS